MAVHFMIREATSADANALATLFSELGFPCSASDVAERLPKLQRDDELILVAESDEVVIGVATVHVMPVLHRPTAVGRVSSLIVTKQVRGQGAGRALVEAAERELSRRGCGLVEVTSNQKLTEAHSFYEHLGYEVTSLRFKKQLR